MLHMLAAVLTVAFGLSACTNAYGEEILNLELLCEGKAEMTFEDPNAAKKYENMREMFGDAIGFNLLTEVSKSDYSLRWCPGAVVISLQKHQTLGTLGNNNRLVFSPPYFSILIF